jgi:Protein of unknown function (DUF3551)
MRTIFAVSVLGLAVLGPVALGSGPASAAVYPWCAYYGGRLSGTNCGFVTFEQCMAAISGNGGFCNNNPLYAASTAAVVVQHQKRRYYSHHHHRHHRY